MAAADPLSATLFALADPTRRGILAQLVLGDKPVKELAAPYAMSTAAVSKHLKVLEQAGLVTRSRAATSRPCHLEAQPLADVARFLESYREFWQESTDALAEHLAELQKKKGKKKK